MNSTPPRKRRASRLSTGFTLIELMVVVAIIAVIAAIALPSYQSSVRKSRRSDAIVVMQSIQQTQERWRANNASYNSFIGPLAASSPTTATVVSPDGYYNLTLSNASGSSYTITAVPTTKGGQDKDACTSLILGYSAGTTSYTFTPSSASNCWSR